MNLIDRLGDDHLPYLKEAAQHPERVFFEFESHVGERTSLTGAALLSQARAIGCRLQMDFPPQTRVLLAFSQGPQFISALLGCFYANVIAIPLGIREQASWQRQMDILRSLAIDAKASCVLTHGIFSTTAVMYDAGKRMDNVSILFFDEVLHTSYREQEPRQRSESDLGLILYTSGSISSPKGIAISHSTLVAQSANGVKQWQFDASSRIVSWLPQIHNFGLHFGILSPLLSGAKSFLLEPSEFVRSPSEWLSALHRNQATHTAAPNFAFDECCSMIDLDAVRHLSLKTLRAVVCGGEPVQEETYRSFTKKFSEIGFDARVFCPHYGLSEIGSVSTSMPGFGVQHLDLDSRSLEEGMVRLAVPGQRNRVVLSCGEIPSDLGLIIYDETTRRPAALDKLGEIWINSTTTANGYLNQRRETGRVFRAKLPGGIDHQRYFRTGDIGFVTDGKLYLVGRKKNVMIVRGKNHHPADVEASIKQALSQRRCATAVFACDISGKDRVIAIQELETTLTEGAYTEIVRKILSVVSEEHGLELHEINLVARGSISRSASGKIQRRPFKDFYLQGKMPYYFQFTRNENKLLPEINISMEALTGRRKISELLKKLLKQDNVLQNSDNDSWDDSLKELGLSSLQGIRLAGQIEKTFGIHFSPVLLFKYESVSQLAAYIESIKTGRPIDEEVELVNRRRPQSLPVKGSDIAVIGISSVFPGASTEREFWKNLIDGKMNVTTLPPERLEMFCQSSGIDAQFLKSLFPQWGGFVDNVDKFDARFFGINRMEAECMDPQQRKLLELTWSVIEASGYEPNRLAKNTVGVFVGVHNVDYADHSVNRLSVAQHYGAYLDSGLHLSMLANRVSKWFDFHGPSEVINTACSSSLVALDHAVESLLQKKCKVAIAAGINLILSPRIYIASNHAGMLAPDGRCKTFAQDADGFVRSEGYGAVLLKELADAVRDGDHIWGIIKGTAINHDGRSNSLRAPNLKAQAQLIEAAYRKARVPMSTIGYVEAHGTGTKIGDPIEISALMEAFRQLDPGLVVSTCGLGTVKTNIGHCESAAGIAGLIKVLLSMHHGIIPGIRDFEKLNPLISFDDSPFYIVKNNQKWKRAKSADGSEEPRRAGISSFGFGGVNAHIVVEEYQMPIKSNRYDPSVGELVLLSARDEIKLREQILRLLFAIRDQKLTNEDLSSIGYTLQVGRAAFKRRVGLLVTSIDDLVNKLTRMLANDAQIEHVYYGQVEDERSFIPLAEDELSTPVTDRNKMEEILKGWIKGAEFDWEKIFYADCKPYRLNLPTYPFALDRYWIDITAFSSR